MSPSIGNFVHDLVEMAKATETLPQVQSELAQTRAEADAALRTVQDRELAIIEYKRQVEELHAKVRALEVERDDASFRALEKEDSLNQVVRFLSGIRQDVDTTLGVVNPPKPEPVLEIVPELPPELAAVELFPFSETTMPSATSSEGSGLPEEGKSAADPIPFVPSDHKEATPSGQGTAGNTPETHNVDTPHKEIVHGPYHGKRYRDVMYYVSIDNWLAGGGAKEDYYGVYPNPTAAQ
jgi:hypothetical protein